LQYDFEIKGAKVFATCNELNRLSKPLQSRFRKLFLPRYTDEQFVEVSMKVLPKLSSDLARYIGVTVFKIGGDIRDVLSIGKLVQKDHGPMVKIKMQTTSNKQSIDKGRLNWKSIIDQVSQELEWFEEQDIKPTLRTLFYRLV
jgi:hypothetical protein